jgi:multiple sugar transport system substrate-binding protein
VGVAAGAYVWNRPTRNVPSTFQSLAASNLRKDPHFATFLDVFGNPDSNTTPNSTSDNAMDALDKADYQWQAGQLTDLRSALADADRQVDAVLAH